MAWKTIPAMEARAECLQSMRKKQIQKLFSLLSARYGPQGWWPVTPEEEHAPRYGVPNHNERQKLEIVIGAILTQNTQWKPNVERAIIELNRKGLIDSDRILEIGHEELVLAIRSAGYYNQKAKKLKNVAAFLKEHPLKELEKMDVWKARELFLGVNGIGPETADSILLYALNKPVFVVDAYTKRMFARLNLIPENAGYDDVQTLFMACLAHDAPVFNEYHALIVQHGKEFCRKSAFCERCFLECKNKRS
jgi:endonuclease III related protein